MSTSLTRSRRLTARFAFVTSLGLFVVVGFALTPRAQAQQLELPAPSPAAKVSQRVGLTDISLEYSSPGAKGRPIWGALVPYEKIWRTGANASTKVTFSRNVTFGGKAVPAGTYSLVTIPTTKTWTVILSKELALFSGGKSYDAKDDVVRVTVTPAAAPMRERMTFLFASTTDTQTSLDLEWEKLRVSVPIVVDTAAQVQANITAAVDGGWRPHLSAARYLVDNTTEYDRALGYVDTSIAIKSTWLNNWVKAQALAKKGRYPDALKHAQVAWDLGDKDPGFFARDDVKKALTEWKAKK